MRRREFIAGLGGAAAMWPLAARAQQPGMPVIGFLHGSAPGPATTGSDRFAAFHRGLAETGYVDGRNLTIEYRFARGQNERLAALAAELVRLRVRVIATPGSGPGALAAKAATQSIPIVFVTASDPVSAGLVASLNHPGGNVTGFYNLSSRLIAKRVELLRELLPSTDTFALLVNPSNPTLTEVEREEAQRAAQLLGVRLLVLSARGASEIETAFATLARQQVGALLVSADSIFVNQQDQLVALAARNAVPTVYEFRDFAISGGLMSYGASLVEEFRQAGIYTGRILNGESPANLPVQQATKIELAINTKTAKALGLTFPITLLGRADEVIE